MHIIQNKYTKIVHIAYKIFPKPAFLALHGGQLCN